MRKLIFILLSILILASCSSTENARAENRTQYDYSDVEFTTYEEPKSSSNFTYTTTGHVSTNPMDYATQDANTETVGFSGSWKLD